MQFSALKRSGNAKLSGLAGEIIRDYTQRKFFKSLGYTSSYENLDILTVECFLIIGSEESRIDQENIKKHQNQAKLKGKIK